MRKIVLPLGGALLSGLVLGLGSATVEARPNYYPEFKAAYPSVTEANVVKCGVCHVGKPTAKTWNDYGTAFSKTLGKKKANKEEAKAALKKVESQPSSVEGKTFGDLLKEGKLPGKAEPAN